MTNTVIAAAQHALGQHNPGGVLFATRNSFYRLWRGRVSGGVLPEPVDYDRAEVIAEGRFAGCLLVTAEGRQVLRTSVLAAVAVVDAYDADAYEAA